MKAEDYEVVKVIGRGAFGEVQLVCISALLWVYYTSQVLKGHSIWFHTSSFVQRCVCVCVCQAHMLAVVLMYIVVGWSATG